MNEANVPKVKTVQDNAALNPGDISTRTRELGPFSFESHCIKRACRGSSLISSAFSGNLDVQKFPPSPPYRCVTCSESSTAAYQQRCDSFWSSDDEFEYLLEARDVRNEAQLTIVQNNAGTTEKLKEEISVNAPIFEDSLNFEEFPGAERDLHKRVDESDFTSNQSVTSNVPFPFGSCTVDPLSATFPSSDSYSCFSTENVDYCDSLFGIQKSHILKEREKCVWHTNTNNKCSLASQDGRHHVDLETSDATSIHRSTSFLAAITKLADDDACGSCSVQSFYSKSNGYDNSDSSTPLESPPNNVATSALAISGDFQPPQTDAILEHAIVSPSGSWHQVYDSCSDIHDHCGNCTRTVDFPADASLQQLKYKIQADTSRAETISSDCCEENQRGISRSDLSWNQRFIELQKFKSIHGHCNVPQKYEKNPSLGAWVARNRLFMRQWDAMRETSRVSPVQNKRMKLLKDIGLAPCIGKGAFGRTTGHLMSSRNTREWENQFNILQTYRATHGNCDVPVKSDEYRSLGRWVSSQRKKYRQYFDLKATGKPSNDLLIRFERLKKIGFNFCIGSGNAKRGK